MEQLSAGVMVAPIAQSVLAFDGLTGNLHVMNRSAGVLLAAGAHFDSIEHLAVALAPETGHPSPTIVRDLIAGQQDLLTLGLLGRGEGPPPSRPLLDRTSEKDLLSGQVHRVIDHGIRFRSNDQHILDLIDGYLGTGLPGTAPTVDFEVTPDAGGAIALATDTDWLFPNTEDLLRHLITVLNEYAVRSTSCLVLHAGAVRSPNGDIAIIQGPSGAGKSTLVAALVRAGFDYGGDEAVGVRPQTLGAVGYPKRLSLSAQSREVLSLAQSDSLYADLAELSQSVSKLAGDLGPISGIYIPRFDALASNTVDELTTVHAARSLVEAAMNLVEIGQLGFSALCELADHVPVRAISYSDASWAATAIARLNVTG